MQKSVTAWQFLCSQQFLGMIVYGSIILMHLNTIYSPKCTWQWYLTFLFRWFLSCLIWMKNYCPKSNVKLLATQGFKYALRDLTWNNDLVNAPKLFQWMKVHISCSKLLGAWLTCDTNNDIFTSVLMLILWRYIYIYNFTDNVFNAHWCICIYDSCQCTVMFNKYVIHTWSRYL